MKSIPSGHELIERAEQLGVSIYANDANVPIGTKPIIAPAASEYEIQYRVMQAEKHLREHRLWMVALASAITALVSAVAAWAAVLVNTVAKSC